MAIFSRVRSRLSGNQAIVEDPHDWKFPKDYSLSSANRTTVVPKFAELRNAFIPPATYDSPKEAFIYPDSSHAAVHLCLLECFRNLRLNATQLDLPSHKPPAYEETAEIGSDTKSRQSDLPASEHWAMLVELATTRFTTWWANIEAVLSHANMYVIRGGSRNEVQLSANYLPPLDVLMVWYSLMLDHGEYPRVCHAAADIRLQNLCFPWLAIRDVIDTESMQYKLPKAAENLFRTISEQEADILTYLNTPPPYAENVTSPFDIDLVAQVHLQQPFIDDSHDHLWIRSPALHGSLERASLAYFDAQSSGYLSNPTAENLFFGIDLIWRTHRLFPARYSAYCRDTDFDPSTTAAMADLKITHSSETTASSTSGSISRTPSANIDVCICWTCERIRDDAHRWTYDKSTKRFDLTTLSSLSSDDVEQIQDDVGFYRVVESNRRAGLPLPTRPPTAAEREADKLESKKKKDAGLLPGIGEYVEVLPNGKTRIRVSKTVRAAYGYNWTI